VTIRLHWFMSSLVGFSLVFIVTMVFMYKQSQHDQYQAFVQGWTLTGVFSLCKPDLQGVTGEHVFTVRTQLINRASDCSKIHGILHFTDSR
jgi:hypothetical protein